MGISVDNVQVIFSITCFMKYTHIIFCNARVMIIFLILIFSDFDAEIIILILLFLDIRKLNRVAVRAIKSCMLILGGGVAKHHICNANLMVN